MVSKIKLEILKMELQLEESNLNFLKIDLTLGKTNLRFKKKNSNLKPKSYWVQIILGVPKFCHSVTLSLSFLPSPFLPCKDSFMDDYDGI